MKTIAAVMLFFLFMQTFIFAAGPPDSVESEHPVFLAVKNGNYKAVQDYLKNSGDPNITGRHGSSLLKRTIENLLLITNQTEDKEKIGLLLIASGADVNWTDPSNGESLLMHCIWPGYGRLFDAILEKLKDVNQVDSDGQTILHRIIRLNFVFQGGDCGLEIWNDYDLKYYNYIKHMIERLVKKGIDVNKKDNSGHTAIDYLTQGYVIVTHPVTHQQTDHTGMVRDLLISGGAVIPDIITAVKLRQRESALRLVPGNRDRARLEEALEIICSDIVFYDWIDVVDLLLKNGVDVNRANSHGYTYLMMACKLYENQHFVEFLLKKNADPNKRNSNGETALMMPSENNYGSPAGRYDPESTAVMLLKHGADMNIANNKGENAFLVAARMHSASIWLFLEKGADVNARDKEGNSCLSYLHARDWILLLIEKGYRISSIYEATMVGDLAAIRQFPGIRATVNAFSARYENLNPLFIAIYYSHQDIVKYFLENGADVNVRGTYGYTALIYALRNNYKERNQAVVKLLLSRNPDLSIEDENGQTALHVACESVNLEIIRLLVEKKTDVNVVNKSGMTPLMECISSDAALIYRDDKAYFDTEKIFAIAKYLLEHGADVNIQVNGNGWYGPTALALALLRSHDIKIIKLLFDHGADPNVRFTQKGMGWAEYDTLSLCKDKETFTLLISHGANPAMRIYGVSLYVSLEGRGFKNILEEAGYFLAPTIDNLLLREGPGQDNPVTKNLAQGEKLVLVSSRYGEEIDGIYGYWVQVKTKKGETGWCFDGYLEIKQFK